METSPLNRRGFLGVASLALGGMLVSKESPARYIQSSRNKIIGCYVDTNDINQPEYLDAIQDRLGVNVLLYAPSGYKLPPEIAAMNPLQGDFFPNIYSLADDDSPVLKAIEESRKRGMKIWLRLTGHHYGAQTRPIMSETFEGVNFLDLPRVKYSLETMKTTCFSRQDVNDYETAAFSHIAETYRPEYMYVTHYRYTNPSYWINIFGCACSSCQMEASIRGYDFEKMKKSMLGLKTRLKNLDVTTLRHASRSRMTLSDFLVFLAEDNSVIDWLVFRASLVGDQLKRINSAIKAVTKGRCGFVTDTHNMTLSLYIGHNYNDFIGGASDAFFPLSWCDTQHISVIPAWANQLCEWVPGLDEPTAIKLVVSFFGWEELGLPSDRIHSLLNLDNPDAPFSRPGFYRMFNPDLTYRLLSHEWTRLAAFNRGRLPVHPVIKGDDWPENVGRKLIAKTEELEFSGYFHQRTDSLIDRENL